MMNTRTDRSSWLGSGPRLRKSGRAIWTSSALQDACEGSSQARERRLAERSVSCAESEGTPPLARGKRSAIEVQREHACLHALLSSHRVRRSCRRLLAGPPRATRLFVRPDHRGLTLAGAPWTALILLLLTTPAPRRRMCPGLAPVRCAPSPDDAACPGPAGGRRGEAQARRTPPKPAQVALIFPLFLAAGMEVEMARGRLAGVRGRLLRKDPNARLVVARTMCPRWSSAMSTQIRARRQPCATGTRVP